MHISKWDGAPMIVSACFTVYPSWRLAVDVVKGMVAAKKITFSKIKNKLTN